MSAITDAVASLVGTDQALMRTITSLSQLVNRQSEMITQLKGMNEALLKTVVDHERRLARLEMLRDIENLQRKAGLS